MQKKAPYTQKQGGRTSDGKPVRKELELNKKKAGTCLCGHGKATDKENTLYPVEDKGLIKLLEAVK